MDTLRNNPFDLTRAADFSDSQIRDYWVDFTGEGGLLALIEPAAKTSIHILGGKGSGKTHLMRYCSFPVQQLRHNDDVLSGLRQERYVGIFMRANILDTGRFNGKGQDDDKWGPLFNYYFEIRLCEQLLAVLTGLAQTSPSIAPGLDKAARNASNLFDSKPPFSFDSIGSLYQGLISLRKEVDFAVNNCAFTRSLSVTIRVTQGHLLFGLPELVIRELPELGDVQILYLIDEIENLSKGQQEFLNSLIRHRRDPCSFRLGARLYGMKTQSNYGANEENKEGSEFKRVYLDHIMRSHQGSDGYVRFAKQLCVKHLVQAELLGPADVGERLDKLDRFFETQSSEDYYQDATLKIVGSDVEERKYFKRLRDQLTSSPDLLEEAGIHNAGDVDFVISSLRCEQYPLLEKLNIFMLYQDWHKRRNLKDAATEIARSCKSFCEKASGGDRHKRVYSHFSIDLLAQLYRDYKLPTTPMYAGLDSFIRMSAGVPRNFLIILHNVYKWASFNGEKPFGDVPIPIATQREAIVESANFFFTEDARPGSDVPQLSGAIARLAEYLREVRFASKPVESSPLAFSFDGSALSAQAKSCIQQAENWSYIFKTPRGRPNANSQRIDDKYQLNPMLSPKWDLPISVRGDVRLNKDLANTIFGDGTAEEFGVARNNNVDGMKAPKFGKTRAANSSLPFGFEDDDSV